MEIKLIIKRKVLHLASFFRTRKWPIPLDNLKETWGPFLESPGNFSDPKSNIQIEM